MSVLTQDLHSTATRQLLEICCAFLPEQRAQVKDLAQAKVPWHTIASLYPLDWRHLHANFALPHIPEPLDLVLEIVGTYNTVEDNLWEVEGGAYGAAGKAFFAEQATSDYLQRTDLILQQLPAFERDSFNRAHIDNIIAAIFWYTWSFQNWEKLEPDYARKSLLTGLRDTVAELSEALGEDFTSLEIGA